MSGHRDEWEQNAWFSIHKKSAEAKKLLWNIFSRKFSQIILTLYSFCSSNSM